ncbi:MAG: dihydroneopterin aldolase [Gammaproteobacteria bacterium]|nr:dihydroneopterin aldolase [Gammaproteobacteria bacterium]
MLDKIFIKGLLLEAIIGVYPHEKTVKQPISIDIEMEVDVTLAVKTDLIKDTVDYDLVMDRVTEIVEKSHYDLLESLIEKIATTILSEFKVSKVRCTLCKPRAITNAQSVGISIER